MQQLAQWAPTVISLVAAVYVAGRLTERVAEHTKKLDAHESKLEIHSGKLIKLTSWHEGFSAGNNRG